MGVTLPTACEIVSSRPVREWPEDVFAPFLQQQDKIGKTGCEPWLTIFGRPKTLLRLAGGELVETPLDEALVFCGLFASLREARQKIQEGGVFVSGVKASEPKRLLADGDLLFGRWIVLGFGKPQGRGNQRVFLVDEVG